MDTSFFNEVFSMLSKKPDVPKFGINIQIMQDGKCVFSKNLPHVYDSQINAAAALSIIRDLSDDERQVMLEDTFVSGTLKNEEVKFYVVNLNPNNMVGTHG